MNNVLYCIAFKTHKRLMHRIPFVIHEWRVMLHEYVRAVTPHTLTILCSQRRISVVGLCVCSDLFHVAHINESCATWNKSPTPRDLFHVAHINESCHTYEYLRIKRHFVPWINASCDSTLLGYFAQQRYRDTFHVINTSIINKSWCTHTHT